MAHRQARAAAPSSERPIPPTISNPRLLTMMTGNVRTRPALSVIAYWLFTLVVVYENISGFVWSVVKLDYITGLVRHLGYPDYFLGLLGLGQLAIAVVLIAPGLPILKEWAYAGALLNYSSAVASHLLVGDGLGIFPIAALIYAAGTIGSWALRPPGRRVAATPWIGETKASSWTIAFGILLLLSIASVAALPLIAAVLDLLPPLTA
jgi:DoxX-like protein